MISPQNMQPAPNTNNTSTPIHALLQSLQAKLSEYKSMDMFAKPVTFTI